jgi:hypothetical protein
LQRNAIAYQDKVRESSYNTPQTTGSNYERVIADQIVVTIPNPEKRTDLGRAGSEFATTQCNTYWTPTAISLGSDVDFNGPMGRLALRAVGGTITDTTVVIAAAFKHSAPMLPGSSGLQLPSFNYILDIPGSGADYLYTGMVVDRYRLSQDGSDVAKVSVDLVGSGKHRSPNAVSSLPSASTFASMPKSSCQTMSPMPPSTRVTFPSAKGRQNKPHGSWAREGAHERVFGRKPIGKRPSACLISLMKAPFPSGSNDSPPVF